TGRSTVNNLVTALNAAFAQTQLVGGQALSSVLSAVIQGNQLTITGTGAFTLKDPPALALVSAQTIDTTSGNAPAIGGNDSITLNYGQNVVFGGGGSDTIDIHGVGANVVVGGDGSVTTATASTPDTVIAR